MKQLWLGLGLTLALVASPARAEGSYNFSATPLFMGSADLDKGGTVGLQSMSLTAGGSWKLNDVSNLGIQLQWSNEDWSFENPAAFGTAPWGKVTRIGVSFPFSMALSDTWRLTVTPSVGRAGENGASTSDSVTGGLTAGAFKIFGRGQVLGFGLAGFSDIDKTSLFPFVIVDWKFNENWRLANPLTVGPTGPAGLELSYDTLKGWDFGAGGAWRAMRFRLAQDNVSAPGGIGQANLVPLFARVGYHSNNGWEVDLWGGVSMGNKYSVFNANGDTLVEEDASMAPLAAATLRLKF